MGQLWTRHMGKWTLIGRNILNCSSRYRRSLDNILNLHFQPRDIHSCCRENVVGSSAILSSLIELLQCRDGSLSLSSSEFNKADKLSMIDSVCTFQKLMI